MAKFRITTVRPKSRMIQLSSGIYSRLSVDVTLVRSRVACFIERHVPLIVLTGLSLASFFLQASVLRSALTLASTIMTPLVFVITTQMKDKTPNCLMFNWFGVGCMVFAVSGLFNEFAHRMAKDSTADCETMGQKTENNDSCRNSMTMRQSLIAKAVPVAYITLLVLYVLLMS